MPKSIGFSVWLMAGTSLTTSAQNANVAMNNSSVVATTIQRRRTKSLISTRFTQPSHAAGTAKQIKVAAIPPCELGITPSVPPIQVSHASISRANGRATVHPRSASRPNPVAAQATGKPTRDSAQSAISQAKMSATVRASV